MTVVGEEAVENSNIRVILYSPQQLYRVMQILKNFYLLYKISNPCKHFPRFTSRFSTLKVIAIQKYQKETKIKSKGRRIRNI